MATLTREPKVLFQRHLETLRECAQTIFKHSKVLSPREDDDRAEKVREYWALGASFGLTEKEIVELVYKGLFIVEPGCDCPTCRERKGVSNS